MQRQAEWNKFKNILCIRLDNLGDVLMTTPALRALKESVAGRKITLLASNAGGAIAKYIPEIDDIIIFDTPWEKNPDSNYSIETIVKKIKERKFDAAVIFTVYSQNPLPTAMICYLAGIPRVAGYCRENPYRLITDWIPDKEPLTEIKHEVQRQLDLVRNLGAFTKNTSLSIRISEDSTTKIFSKLKLLDIDTHKNFVIIHPGVSEKKRQYPVHYFAEAAKMIINELECQVLLTGVTSEKTLTEAIAEFAGKNAFDLAGHLTMEELIALIKSSSLLIANNTGPVHIAAAVNTPVVVLYALTNPQHTPWNVNHRILPFDVPVAHRSKNVIIEHAYKKSFKTKPTKANPVDILQNARELICKKKKNKITEVLYL